MRSRLTILSSILALSACATAPALPPIPLAPFNAAEAEYARGTGTGVIEGQAFLKTRGGDVKYGAGNAVLLIPVTTHTTAWMQRVVVGGESIPLATELTPFSRHATADGSGRFTFREVPSGEYYVVTTVTWEIPGQYVSSTQGGLVAARVTARNANTESVIVTR